MLTKRHLKKQLYTLVNVTYDEISHLCTKFVLTCNQEYQLNTSRTAQYNTFFANPQPAPKQKCFK